MTAKKANGVRFAPSPTGSFHVGNLRTAWVSYSLAQALREPWIVRVEDIDTPRVRPEAWAQQKNDLLSLGLTPDLIVVQSKRAARHLELFERAKAADLIYACDCSRKEVSENLAQMMSAPHFPTPEYSGHCRHRTSPKFRPAETLAWRWKSDDETGHHDAIVARTKADGSGFSPGYHWACAIDDADGDYHVLVRAWDLAPVERIQGEIRSWIQTSTRDEPDFPLLPLVFHTSLVTRSDGGRLEKRTQGVTLAELHARGLTDAELVSKFAASFDLENAIQILKESRTNGPGSIATSAPKTRRELIGEPVKTVSLDQLAI